MSAPGLALECMGGHWGVPEKGEKVAKWVIYGLNGQYHFATSPSTQDPQLGSGSAARSYSRHPQDPQTP